MESLRFGLIQQQELHDHRVYEGRPLEFFPHKVSLPPPPDKPPKKQQSQPPQSQPQHDRVSPSASPNMVRTVTPTGKVRWANSPETISEVRRRIAACDSLGAIARSMRLSVATVSKIKREMRAEALGPVVAASSSEPEASSEPAASAAESPAPACEATDPLPAPPAPEPMQLIAQAPLQGAQQSVIAPTPAGEPQRLHILDWGRRMAGYEFSTAPEHCQPGKGRSHGKGMTHHQLNLFIRSDRGPSSGMNINAHSERKPQSMQSIALLFAGA